jgi:hypothetical protein
VVWVSNEIFLPMLFEPLSDKNKKIDRGRELCDISLYFCLEFNEACVHDWTSVSMKMLMYLESK